MEAAHAFAQRLAAYPLAECGEPLACLKTAAGAARVPLCCPDGLKLSRHPRIFHVRESLIEPLLRVAKSFAGRGYLLRIEDAYRTPARQAKGAGGDYAFEKVFEKVRWELDGQSEPTAELIFRRLAVWTATTPKFANHTSGSTIDVGLLAPGGEPVDLGGVYPELSHRTPMASPFISAAARRNRDLVCDLFAAEGFVPYPYEFWHFSRGDADCEMISATGRPARFGPVHWCTETRTLTPVADPNEPLITVEDIRRRLAERKELSPP